MEISNFISGLKKAGLMPGSIQTSVWRDWHMVSAYSVKSSHFISESVSMGIDRNPSIALCKALTEFCERKISKESTDPAAYLTDRSDGFAAFPVPGFSPDYSRKRARENAANEALERFVWATWWDDKNIKFKIDVAQLGSFPSLKEEFNLKDLQTITVPTASDFALVILLASDRGGGFVTGGAAGSLDDRVETYNRAFGELLRHLIVLQNMKRKPRTNLSFYEQRLWGFGSGDFRDLVLERLQSKSEILIDLPAMVADRAILHSHSDLISVHRCLYKDQPIFMGGPVARFCI